MGLVMIVHGGHLFIQGSTSFQQTFGHVQIVLKSCMQKGRAIGGRDMKYTIQQLFRRRHGGDVGQGPPHHRRRCCRRFGTILSAYCCGTAG